MQGSIPGPWDHDLSRKQALNGLSHPSVPQPCILDEREYQLLPSLRQTCRPARAVDTWAAGVTPASQGAPGPSLSLRRIFFFILRGRVERILSRLHAQCRAQGGALSHNPEIMT